MNRMAAALCLAAAGSAASADAGTQSREQLTAEIVAADARLFEGLNRRDIGRLKSGFSPRLEFYHDRSGVTGYAENIAIFEKNFAAPARVRREAMPETVEVFPTGPDHAMHIGKHRFCNKPSPAEPESCGVYRFSMVWERDGGQWKLLRVLSYDH
ncbi:nuclear transport factor 2 family protein [Massilia sp. YIM B02763]|uniref:nuclear transport factor 2 family protein n=1 Tax=Massilia sp. YIM B02763 TaxID=3050130 RepID=UPI0025B6C783|nr:nuclear transport factor 2 family protein [Massilia sp. YIM B02763]MDN4055065.1 nuclear transport factor 2 family protein [Massilia sp. YIM B02763]